MIKKGGQGRLTEKGNHLPKKGGHQEGLSKQRVVKEEHPPSTTEACRGKSPSGRLRRMTGGGYGRGDGTKVSTMKGVELLRGGRGGRPWNEVGKKEEGTKNIKMTKKKLPQGTTR